ncbi:hypothetical protein SAMN04488003_10827 [Loktanella fryxellensis]|uniref:Uncharacterized protein n=1 Tax=Loktanella fryxellensis TaxID=245187 RepID=A0A1H8D6B9_9RHOB|nr:hypothetical protein [Loktanella fryxellensis]SEN02769.1 hypothetical protein SAMN04488003_10827 [Loktanella fryxellensis]
MTFLKSSIVATALIAGLGITAASAASVSDLVATNGTNDRSKTGLEATLQNLDTLGVTTRKGDVLTDDELTAIQRVVLDQGNFSSKARRVDLIVNGESNDRGAGYSF